ncbi:MAG: AAA family ATPase [bacterium]|nr:AAA family ATPase [bacterium]
MNEISISSIKFTNFKALKSFSVTLHDTNILVGPNNAGKSTIISALRILDVALKKARRLKAERVPLPHGGFGFGHRIPEQQICVSLENVATNYNSEDSHIEFRLTNGNKLFLFFPNEGGCILHWDTKDTSVYTPGKFISEFPLKIQVIPILGPLEHEEPYVTEDTVRNALNTHRACRHFRNYWHYFNDDWEKFSEMISSTWPGMNIKIPELDRPSKKLTMFVSEDRIDREVYWAGFGFQVWCQLLTHLSRANEASLVVIDEPEIYLHPDIQRQLLNILRNLKADVLLATHSVEIMGEADPAEILLINKSLRSASRLKDIEGVQLALQSLGSAQNVTLTHLARTRKIVFVEGMSDYKIIRRFSKTLGLLELSSGNDLTAFESGGFSSWEKIKSYAWGVKLTIDSNMKMFAIYDRDYYCQNEIDEILGNLKAELTSAHIHKQKEIENYLLNIKVLERVLDKQIEIKNKRSEEPIIKSKNISDYLHKITELFKTDTQAQYISRNIEYKKKQGIDSSTATIEAIDIFNKKWESIDLRMSIVPGKITLRQLRDVVQRDYGLNLTDVQIIDEFKKEEIQEDLNDLINNLELFRKNKI